jgi:hypothetical protein
VKLTGSHKRDVCAGKTGRIGPILRVQSTQSERRGGCGADENDPVIRRHRPMLRPGTIRVLLSCRWRCREARLSSELSSAHGAKQRHPHRFLIPGDPALTIGCVKGGRRCPLLGRSGSQTLRNGVAGKPPGGGFRIIFSAVAARRSPTVRCAKSLSACQGMCQCCADGLTEGHVRDLRTRHFGFTRRQPTGA